MPAGTGRPYNKGVRVMNRNQRGSGTRAQTLIPMKDEIKDGKSRRRTARAATEFDKSWKKQNPSTGKPPVAQRLKKDNYGPGKKP